MSQLQIYALNRHMDCCCFHRNEKAEMVVREVFRTQELGFDNDGTSKLTQ